MLNIAKSTGACALAMLTCSLTIGQAQGQPRYTRDLCVKVRDGKAQEFTTFLQDVTAKLAKVRMDSGIYSMFAIARATVPAGRSAHCDYHLVYGSIGFPAEAPGAQQTVADYKKAGIKMTVEEAAAKRNELSYLVSTDVWLDRELVGQSTKGGYVRVTYLKTKPGTTSAEWAAMSSATWKPLAEAWVKENPAMGWGSSTLAMPGGTGLAYNAMTLDFFPTWDAIGKGVPSRALWNKVHPDSDMTAYFDRLALIVDRPRIDILKLVEVIVK